ncbi:hypothetical protein OOZ19_17035 [Saccharopolyspora sp. NFXS83]|uniref:hypothetical protein n=1 Tax=Saccharopolyspora sp. NFXS83 TaxID=2993560 RepID=UPI00224B14EA|nr:hypothetical protein [Saccharopolyspora sp. NFXS83]MCX2731949.1 hypothetical protein [Saccharopolyspora sp. NFXS83]
MVASDPEEWRIPDEVFDEMVDTLVGRGYQLRVTSPSLGKEVPRVEQAAYLCLVPEWQVDDLPPGPKLTYAEDGKIIGNQDLVAAVAPLAPDVQWSPSDREEFWELSYAPDLPDPIEIRSLFKKWRRSGGKWVVSHDGREYFTNANAHAIAVNGMAWMTGYRHGGKILLSPPTLIWGGAVIDALVSRGIQFSGSPVYYLCESCDR